MASLYQWRKFQFFEKDLVKDETGKAHPAIEKLDITCATSGRGHLIFGDTEGQLHLMDHNFRMSSFQAYAVCVTHLRQLRQRNTLVSVGDDGGGVNSGTIKIWNLDKKESSAAAGGSAAVTTPLLQRSIKIFSAKFPEVPITAFDVSEDLSYMAVGLATGDVVLISVRDRSSKNRILQAARGKDSPVTSVSLRQDVIPTASGNTIVQHCLFIVTRDSVISHRLSHSSSSSSIAAALSSASASVSSGSSSSFSSSSSSSSSSFLKGASSFSSAFSSSSSSASAPSNLLLAPGEVREELDAQGCEAGCATLCDDQDLVIGRAEAVYFYQPEGRGSCFAFEGDKRSISWFRSYLCVVTSDSPADASAGSAAAVSSAVSSMAAMRRHTLNIYDLKNKLIAYSGPFSRVTHVLQDWGSIFLVVQEPAAMGSGGGGGQQQMVRRMYQLEEKDIQTKLEMLFKKNMYSIAIYLARSQNLDSHYITDIFSKYGDHLYQKGDYDGSIVQFIHTIGRLEPSYVIRKFLDANRIHNLTRYLEALHEKNHANSDHTTLLLNCYTKSKDEEKLKRFLGAPSVGENSWSFDVETAIRVCRQAGYFNHALSLAQWNHQHDWYLKIQLEDLHNYVDAITFIQTLDFVEAEQYLEKHGRTLVSSLPEQATSVLIQLCSEWTPNRKNGSHPSSSSSSSLPSSQSFRSAPSPNIPQQQHQHHASPVDADRAALFAPSRSHQAPASSSPSISSLSLEDSMSSLMSKKRNRAEPENYVHAFVDQPYWLLVFLEYIVSHNPPSAVSTLVYNTLLELYLREGELATHIPERPAQFMPQTAGDKSSVRVHSRQMRLDKALALLQNPDAKYDKEHALVLVQKHGFREGVLFLYEKLELYYDIVQYYMQQNNSKASKPQSGEQQQQQQPQQQQQHQDDSANIIRAAKKYGAKDPNMWIQVLSYFCSASNNFNQQQDGAKQVPNADASASASAASPYEAEIAEVLSTIERDNLLPPLLVIQILSQNGKTKLGTIKDYISRRLQQEHQLIEEDREAIKTYQAETKKMREEIKELKQSAKIFQLSKCVACSSALELPAVHFLCMHSFHARCLGDSSDVNVECPVCAPGNRKVLEAKRSLQESSEQHDQFFRQLGESSDGFSTVAEYFGRGIFNRPVLIQDHMYSSGKSERDQLLSNDDDY